MATHYLDEAMAMTLMAEPSGVLYLLSQRLTRHLIEDSKSPFKG
jgi:hypothetical protein